METIYLIGGLVGGGILGFVIGMLILRSSRVPRKQHEDTLQQLDQLKSEYNQRLADFGAQLDAGRQNIQEKNEEIERLRKEVAEKMEMLLSAKGQTAGLMAKNEALQEKLDVQIKELEAMNTRLNKEFELIAARILEEKSTKFVAQNKEHLDHILKPFGENIEGFKKKVEEFYSTEAKERFSLGKEVEKLVELNQRVSEEASNLTKALKGSVKVQGDWGEMVLKNILEQSGLEEGREYFLQEQLRDQDGKSYLSEDGKKMRPDVIIRYPDNRNVIIDSKVSLTAYTRYTEAADDITQLQALKEHLKSIRDHIDSLSRKSYQEYVSSLDFVMMFIPVEPAYLVALKEDHTLWNYAYQKKILLISPTNLIAALKLIEDLWKREHQSQNALAIAERGAALYDKFVNFVENLGNLGSHLERAQKSYADAYGQLKTGRGNLIGQAEKLREMGVKTKKNLPQGLVEEAAEEDHTPEQ